MSALRVALIGLGATGLRAAAELGGRPGVEIVAAVDRDAGKVGRPLADWAPGAAQGVVVAASLEELPEVDVAVLTTTSHVPEATPLVLDLIGRGADVVSLCEELAYPWRSHPQEAARIDEAAKDEGVSVLGTGCNPGFAMDTLPLLMTAATQGVERIEVERTALVTDYGPLLDKFGFGLTPAEYEAAGEELIGHLGFEQSIAHIAAVLGWELEEIVVDDPQPAAIASEPIEGEFVSVGAGTVASVEHGARGSAAGGREISLRAYFGFLFEGDGVPRGDRYLVRGREFELDFASSAGIPSFPTTISMLANCVAAIGAAAPGLRCTSDFSVRQLASAAETA